MARITIPDGPPSGRTLAAQELRDRRAQLEWLHERAEPRRKKRVDPREQLAIDAAKLRSALGDYHEYD